jgi:hypothetical protein
MSNYNFQDFDHSLAALSQILTHMSGVHGRWDAGHNDHKVQVGSRRNTKSLSERPRPTPTLTCCLSHRSQRGLPCTPYAL